MVGPVGASMLDVEPLQADAAVSLALVRHVLAVLGHDDHEILPEDAPGFHPGRSAAVRLGGEPLGHVGELAPRAARALGLQMRVAIAELALDPLLAPVERILARSPSVFPHVDFDLSFVVSSEMAVADLIRATVEAGSGLVESARVFDVFHGAGVEPGSRAVAVSYRLRADDHTLSNEEVKPMRLAMITAAEGLGARLRGA
jgi:phenylalanyl-tRNA synthetase beta chain